MCIQNVFHVKKSWTKHKNVKEEKKIENEAKKKHKQRKKDVKKNYSFARCEISKDSSKEIHQYIISCAWHIHQNEKKKKNNREEICSLYTIVSWFQCSRCSSSLATYFYAKCGRANEQFMFWDTSKIQYGFCVTSFSTEYLNFFFSLVAFFFVSLFCFFRGYCHFFVVAALFVKFLQTNINAIISEYRSIYIYLHSGYNLIFLLLLHLLFSCMIMYCILWYHKVCNCYVFNILL